MSTVIVLVLSGVGLLVVSFFPKLVFLFFAKGSPLWKKTQLPLWILWDDRTVATVTSTRFRMILVAAIVVTLAVLWLRE